MSFIPLSTVTGTIQSYCKTTTGLAGSKCILAYQGGPRPDGSFITITPITGALRRGAFDERIYKPNGDLEVVHRRQINAQIDCYGPNAEAFISQIFDGLDIPPFYDIFTAEDFNARFTSGIRDISAIQSIRFEKRFNVDMVIDITYSTIIAVDLDGRTPTPGTYPDGSEIPDGAMGASILLDDIGWFDSIRLTDNILGTPDNTITGD